MRDLKCVTMFFYKKNQNKGGECRHSPPEI